MTGDLIVGAEAAVSVPVATLWRSPDRVRPVDRPAVETVPDAGTWAATMTATDRADLLGRTESQLLVGESVLVEAVHEGWARIVALGQPSSKDPRGYPGWVLAAHLAQAPVAASPGPVGPVERADAVDIAERFLGVRYVWGGLSPDGIDCSGLVHLAYRHLGVTLPRDAHDQADATIPVAFGTEQRGDLYFFARPGRPIHHVGFVTAAPDADGTRQMLHASGGGIGVVAEPISGERTDTLVAAHRVSLL